MKTTIERIPAALGREQFIEVEQNVRLHVIDYGQGDPVILIHGWPLSAEMYEYQYQQLANEGYRVIGISLRGFGKSDKPYGRYDYDVFADDIEAVLDQLDISGATLGGFSMGGAIAIRYATRYNAERLKKLALFAAAAPSLTKRDGFDHGFSFDEMEGLRNLAQTNRPQFIEEFGKLFGATETSIPKGLSDWLKASNLEASAYATTECLTALRDTDLRAELSSIKIPTAIFHGAHDKICEFALGEYVHKALPQSRFVRFENSGHGLFLEEREKFNRELLGFLSR